MIYLEPSAFGWDPLFQSWLASLPAWLGEGETGKLVKALFSWLVQPGLTLVRKKLKVRTCMASIHVCINLHGSRYYDDRRSFRKLSYETLDYRLRF